ncbi:intradiol ring-cleavage dioxygenase [Kribbella sp. NBC_00709]|uniref:intradiol ring-cleavage dioxygenase n=1 Tax=Kribbella sp. NBC_00709 TaxID=2975972 RepID=UPI002E28289E|nr:intradiol ring-cleavage dioxygenase [Kribbella sp. NBC_00709]
MTRQPPPNHDRGLGYDLATLHRRRFLGLVAGAGLVAVTGCSDTDTPATPAAGTTSSVVDEIPQETGGPFPGDGSNGPNVLAQSGIVRKDLTKSFGTATGQAAGVPLSVELTVLDASKDTPLEGAAIYLWHCDAQGRYSLYSDGVTEENYLRGVQSADTAGKVTFTTIFPAAYQGRWPHIHFEVYPSVDEATRSGQITRTSQLALPKDVCATVYGTDGYDGSAENLSRTSLEDDNVFGDDDGVHQLATVTGDVDRGYIATLTVGV